MLTLVRLIIQSYVAETLLHFLFKVVELSDVVECLVSKA